jgi:nucleoside-diphosphate-sugar epimerase
VSRVLVTGATGFVGRHALAPLAERGFEVHAVARRRGTDRLATWHELDLLRDDPVPLLARLRPTHLLHLAWNVEPPDYWRSPENLRWVEASLRLLRAFSGAGGSRAVAAGTCAEYDWSAGLCDEAETPLAPATLYGTAKDALRRLASAYAREAGLSLAWGRIFFCYGPDEHPSRLVASVARALARGEEAPCSEGRQLRDFLHVADVAAAFVALVGSELEGPANVGSGVGVPVREVVARLAAAAGRPDLVRVGVLPPRPDEAPVVVAGLRRRAELGWTPRIDLDEGLAETLAWWRRRDPAPRAA